MTLDTAVFSLFSNVFSFKMVPAFPTNKMSGFNLDLKCILFWSFLIVVIFLPVKRKFHSSLFILLHPNKTPISLPFFEMLTIYSIYRVGQGRENKKKRDLAITKRGRKENDGNKSRIDFFKRLQPWNVWICLEYDLKCRQIIITSVCIPVKKIVSEIKL